MCKLPSNTHRKQGDSLNSREGRDLSKHTPHPCLTTSRHTHILRINTTVHLTVLDMFRSLLSSTRLYFNLARQDQEQPTALLRNKPVETSVFNHKLILTIQRCINKGATMITSPIRITRNINTNIRIALG